MVGDLEGQGSVSRAGGVVAEHVAQERDAPRLVVGDPVVDAVAEAAGNDIGVVDEGVHRGAVGPAARVLQGLGQVPMVQGDKGADARRQQPINQALVEVEAARIDRARAIGQDARPGDREAIGCQAQALHQGNVVAPAVVVVVGHIARVAVVGLTGRVAEGIPDGWLAAILGNSALDLVGGRGGSPQEVGRELGCHGILADC